ncbi:MAG: TonB family protein [Akkermansia sp.]
MFQPAPSSPRTIQHNTKVFRADGKRLRASLRQRIHQDRRLAWKLLPLLLLLLVGLLSYGLNIKSTLGEMGDSLSRIGQITSFESPEMSVQPESSAPTPPSATKEVKPIIEPEAQQLDSDVVMELPPADIKVKEINEVEPLELDIKLDTSSIVDISELAIPEEMPKVEEAKPKKATKKPAPAAQLASNASSSTKASKSSLGSASSKAAGRISVSYKKAPQPPYPARMRASKTNGTVIVRIHVDAAGRPQSVHIKKGSGHDEFDDIAQSWILNHWLFNPAKENGHAVASVVTTSIHFVYG